MPCTRKTLEDELEDLGARFDGAPDLEFRLATDALERERCGLGLQRIPPGYRFPDGHTHGTQEEVYVVVGGTPPRLVELIGRRRRSHVLSRHRGRTDRGVGGLSGRFLLSRRRPGDE